MHTILFVIFTIPKNSGMRPALAVLTIFLMTLLTGTAQEIGSFKDSRDGKTYKTIKIGSQVWMAENLGWKAGKECWAYNNADSLVGTYGYLYTWEMAQRSCPSGWHLPSDDEWNELTRRLGGDSIASGKLKAVTPGFWKSPNPGATNESGFTGLPAGNRSGFDGAFYGLGKYTFWWTATEYNKTGEIYVRSIDYHSTNVSASKNNREFGYSVRCVKN
jgi:uncharacterized protein (TIGR02145 family)